jgi:uncharacterized LabA/DUF88 family protein
MRGVNFWDEGGSMRAAIFIDGAYLEKIVKLEFNLVQIDFAILSEVMAGGREILRTYYYNCLPYQSSPPSKEEKERFSNKQRFFTYLERLPKYTVRLGRLAYRGIEGGEKKFEQKGIDTLLCVDMVNLAATHQISNAALLAGDSDCIPGIKIAKEHGVGITLYHSQDRDSYHWQLWQECDERFPMNGEFIDRVRART